MTLLRASTVGDNTNSGGERSLNFEFSALPRYYIQRARHITAKQFLTFDFLILTF